MKILKFIGGGCLIYILIMFIASMFFLNKGSSFFEDRNDPLKKAESCIEQMDFVQARVHLNDFDTEIWGKEEYCKTLEKVCRAQVFHLIGQGEFILAQQIAKEDGLPQVYLDALLVQLPQIYGQQPILSLLNALSIATFSDVQAEYDKQVHNYNTSLDSFCKTLYSIGKKQDAKAFLNLLKPDYNGSTVKINKIKSQYR